MMERSAAPLRVLELFCGIGGCAAALGGQATVVAAVDQNRKALTVYGHNFPHATVAKELAALPEHAFRQWEADLWWLSPPCQPYTRRGRQRDVGDPRAAGLLSLLPKIAALRPAYVALENVPGFEVSRSRALLLETLAAAGYAFREWRLCPSELGVPNRRRRYYLVASRRGPWLPDAERRPLAAVPWRFRVRDILDPEPDERLWPPPEPLERFAHAIDIVQPEDDRAVTKCFTAGYGRSLTHSGSYLATPRGPRWFAPSEILRLLAFPPTFHLPPGMSAREAWPLVGNSLSLAAVRHVLRAIPELAG